MRCKSCGWVNPDGAQKCVKCNAPLSGSMVEQNVQPMGGEVERSVRQTKREVWSGQEPQQAPGNYKCECGYLVPSGAASCPNCGAMAGGTQPVQNQQPIAAPQPVQMPNGYQQKPAMGGTVVGGFAIGVGPAAATDSFTLKPLPFQNEQVQYQPITFSGNSVVLNRQNTDPNNNTITSKQQAVIVQKEDGWYISNCSAGKTTYIQVTHEMKLEPGDVVIMGNRAFEFGKL